MKRFWYVRRRPETIQSEVDEELRTHLDMRTEELVASGMTHADARREAVQQFGDLMRTREYCRRQDMEKEGTVHRRLMLEDLAQDLRIGLRGLLRTPMTTLIIMTTVGLGIGATTTIFAAIDAALLRPLPYTDPSALVRIYTDAPPNKFRFSAADYLALESQQTTFDRVAAYNARQMTFTDGATAERIPGKLVTWTYFGTLGVRPAIGRDFEPSEGKPGGLAAAIVSHRFWQQRLGGRPGDTSAIGKPIRLDGADYTVVGVLPPAVGPLERNQDFFVAAQIDTPRRKGPFLFLPIGRVKTSRAAAAEELRAINKRIFPIWKASYQDDKATWAMQDLQDYVVGDVRTIAGLAIVAVALVWLIACTNASNLLVARVTARRRELAVRAALGASRGRVVRYLLAESLLLAIGAAAIGVPLAYAGIGAMRDFGTAYFPRTAEIAIDGRVLWLLVGLTFGSALLFGLVPAVHGSGAEAQVDEPLRSTGRSSTGSVSVRRLRRALVASQFAIATPLLVVAGLLLASLSALGRVDLGFDTRNLVTGSLLLPPSEYPAERAASFWQELRRRVEAIPGVSAVAYADGRPPNGVGNHNNFDLEDAPTPAGQSQPVVPWVGVSPDYFKLLGLQLLEGRLLDERDSLPTAESVIVVDRAWARRFFPNGSAVGRRLKNGGCTSCAWTVVVGVVTAVKYDGLDRPDNGTVYWPWSPQLSMYYLIARTGVTATTIVPQLRDAVRRLDADLPLSEVATMDDLVDQSLTRPRSLSVLVVAVAAVALLLSLIGIYGVMAYYVQQHAKDIGIRLALGGSRGDLFRLVVGQGMRVVAGGVALGLLAALLLTRAMSSLLFGVGAADVTTFAAAAALMTVVAFTACALPAHRAVGVEPATVLRDE